jgi:hypothetical protein
MITFQKSIVKLFSISSFILFVVMISCQKKDGNLAVEQNEKVYINNNIENLNQRVTYIYSPAFSTHGDKSINDYYWYYVAEVASPFFNGQILSATHVDIIDEKAYISYNVQGNVYAGGIEVIDLENPAYPTIITQLLFMGNDANAVVADMDGTAAERDVYLALSSFKKGAVLRKLHTQNGQFVDDFTDLSLSKSLDGNVISASANGLACTQEYIYVTSGQSYGGVFQINKPSFSVNNVDAFDAAKYVAVNGYNNGAKQVSLSTGDESKLHIYNVGPSLDNEVIDIGAIYHQNVDEPYSGKSVSHIDESSNICFVSMGLNGMKAFDITSGEVIYTSPTDMLTNGNTNGLSKDELFVYLANGADGLFVGDLPQYSGTLIPVQVWDMNESGASANLVKASGDWLFVAKGGGGLKILRRVRDTWIPPVCDFDEQGVPECLETFEFCGLLPEHMDLTLPERVNAFDNRPEYFLNDNYEIELDESAQLSVVFISEGAGLKNSFGYYHYPTNNPPTSVEEIQSTMRIVFPNASEMYSGGQLRAGDMVHLGEEFDAGTTVGFFLLANSWNDGDITEGVYQQYTRRALNYNGLQQHILMYDSICDCITIGIEDILSDRGDKDFNDLVFQIVIEPETAFNSEQIIQIPPQ